MNHTIKQRSVMLPPNYSRGTGVREWQEMTIHSTVKAGQPSDFGGVNVQELNQYLQDNPIPGLLRVYIWVPTPDGATQKKLVGVYGGDWSWLPQRDMSYESGESWDEEIQASSDKSLAQEQCISSAELKRLWEETR